MQSRVMKFLPLYNWRSVLKAVGLLSLLGPVGLMAQSSGSSSAAGIVLAKDVDVLWVIIAAALVFLMQVGFLFLETGMVRAKNSINVAMKNLLDFVLGFLMFFFLGYGIMFGTSLGGWIGGDLFLLEGLVTDQEFALFVFQVTFMGTAATIVSGAVSERMRFSAYIIASICVSLIIYPVFGHWVWGGGWLAEMGFLDFAGSSVVHSVGGWVALAGVLENFPMAAATSGRKRSRDTICRSPWRAR